MADPFEQNPGKIAAQRELTGKVNALGIGWSNVAAAELPVNYPQMAFVASLSGTKAEAGTKRVELSLIDADGTNVFPTLENDLDFVVQEPALRWPGHRSL